MNLRPDYLARLAGTERSHDGPYPAYLLFDASVLRRRYAAEAAAARRFHLRRALKSLGAAGGSARLGMLMNDALAECRRARNWQHRLGSLAVEAGGR